VRERSGFFYTVGAYLFWGIVFPVFFASLSSVNPFEIVPIRMFSSLLFAALIVLASRSLPKLRAALRSKRDFGLLALAGVLLYANWQSYVFAIVTDHVIEASLAYFINPFVTILLAVAIRRERVTRTQWVALGVAFLAVIVLTASYGQPPWLALVIAFSFGLYGFVKKQAADDIDAAVGMTVETVALIPVAIIQLVILYVVSGEIVAFTQGLNVQFLLLLSGPVTIVPLILFAAGTKRLPLVYVGFVQFLTPVLTFLYGYFIMREPMPAIRWVGFIIIWVALVILIADLVKRMRSNTRDEGEAAVQLNRIR
jgi:chloramphenicol-sensitive protein RarD